MLFEFIVLYIVKLICSISVIIEKEKNENIRFKLLN